MACAGETSAENASLPGEVRSGGGQPDEAVQVVDHAPEQGLGPLGGGDAGREALAAEEVVISAVVPGVGHEPLEQQDVMSRRGERDGVAKEHDAYQKALERLLRDLKVESS